jgi:hypothetical protein
MQASGAGPARVLRIQTELQIRTSWLIVKLSVNDRSIIDMVLDTGSPFSAISEGVRDALVAAISSATSRSMVSRSPTSGSR